MMTRSSRVVLAAAAIVSLIVIAAVIFVRQERVPKPVRLAGRTVGAGGAPLADVRVTLEIAPSDSEEEAAVERVQTQSDAQGNFSIDFQGHWRRASYRLEAQKPGYQTLWIEGADSLRNPVTLKLVAGSP